MNPNPTIHQGNLRKGGTIAGLGQGREGGGGFMVGSARAAGGLRLVSGRKVGV